MEDSYPGGNFFADYTRDTIFAWKYSENKR